MASDKLGAVHYNEDRPRTLLESLTSADETPDLSFHLEEFWVEDQSHRGSTNDRRKLLFQVIP